MYDDMTDEDLYKRYFFERIKSQHTDIPELIDAIAERWRRYNPEDSLSKFACWYCSDITGIPDYDHFMKYEMTNPRIVMGLVEIVPDRWLQRLGITREEMYQVHREKSHHER